MEYFGLEHWIPNQKESRTHQWINLRNRLSCDGGSGSGIQLMLALRVKFWVPVHFILQESVRNLFYMQAKSDLLNGLLNAKNWSVAAKLAALLCQADGLRFNETSVTAECPLKIKKEQEKLKCQQSEQLAQQEHIHSQQQHYQQQPHSSSNKERKEKDHVLSFKKRRLSKQKSVENIDNSLPISPASISSNSSTSGGLTALATNLRQAENNKSTSSTNQNLTKVPNNGNSTCDNIEIQHETDESIEKRIASSPLRIYQDYIIRPIGEEDSSELPEGFLKQIAIEHGKLSMLKMSPKSAKYWLLQEIQDLPGYGEEVFSGVTTSENSQRCDVAVGAHGIKVASGDSERKYVILFYINYILRIVLLKVLFYFLFFFFYCSIPFSAIAAAKSFRRTFKLEYVDDHNIRREVEIKLPKHPVAAGLYRSITERHAFYVCDKVRGVVTNQFTRDLKGTIASMFNEDTELGKRYVFDIQHTSREVHDQARRILHERGIETSILDVHSGWSEIAQYIPRIENSDTVKSVSPMSGKLDLVIREKEEREAAIERCVDIRISEAMTCKICMDHAINTMFNPCCHVMACAKCAARCDNCPNCRVKITSVVKIFLPPELRTTQSNDTKLTKVA